MSLRHELALDTIAISGDRAFNGSVRTPGDKSISHRALILAALTEGISTISGLSSGSDVEATRLALLALGAKIFESADGLITIEGGHLQACETALDCGNSGTGMRLLMGLCAGLEGTTTLAGDDSLSSRPMGRVGDPLISMGAIVSGRQAGVYPPVTIKGGSLRAIDYAPPMASAQVKSAVLLAGLKAEGTTIIREAVATRRHSEEMLLQAGADITIEEVGAGLTISLKPSKLRPRSWTVPGDPSQAAFWMVAGSISPGSAVAVRAIYGGKERTGFVDVLNRMGAQIQSKDSGEGSIDLTVTQSALHGTVIHAHEIPSVDEVPALTVAACAAVGPSTFVDVAELRIKESDRFAACVGLARALGAEVTVEGDSFTVHGLGSSQGFANFSLDSHGDHRIAMAAAIAASAGNGGRLAHFSMVATSYPNFLADLRSLTGSGVRALEPLIVAIDGPAGSGKSSVAKAVAAQLGLDRLDTGSMYRAVAAALLDAGSKADDHGAMIALAKTLRVSGDGSVMVNDQDQSARLRDLDVSSAVSQVASFGEVRSILVDAQRSWARDHRGGVVEGRDIGSTVFPDATAKIYLTASEEVRAARRKEEGSESVLRRDRIDTTRAVSPLSIPDGACVIDTTELNLSQAVEAVLAVIKP
ncbi:MAG: 3-phosphoshikimate 1-carboxyvinyltransferase [Actinomycetes bacterium]